MVMAIFSPLRDQPKVGEKMVKLKNYKDMSIVLWVGIAAVKLCHMRLLTLCRRFEQLVHLLLIARDPSKKREGFIGAPEQEGDGLEIETPGVNADASLALLFFVGNLLLCVLWYAYRYDERGTVNLIWTDVFG